MLSKMFGYRKSKDISTVFIHALQSMTLTGSGDKQSRTLKIIHAGGHVDRYYMATPADRIMQKHPSFVLARPDIFRKPWDSVVRSHELLVPGQKYYLVPRGTVKKLRRRIRKPSAIGLVRGQGPDLSSTKGVSSRSFSGILVKSGIKVKARDRHVMFLGLETANKKEGSINVPNPSSKKNGKKFLTYSNQRSSILQKGEKNRRAKTEFSWEPSLQSINE